MMLTVKEVFYSLQGEGYNTGRPAVFVRFSGCNLWSGRRGRDKLASVCKFCDTDFIGGDRYSEAELADKILDTWQGTTPPFIVFTGGEPSLQLRNSLFSEIHDRLRPSKSTCSFAIETNGTTEYDYDKPVWVTVSPKTKGFVRRSGSELKLLWPLDNLHPDEIGFVDFKYKYLQPIHDKNYNENLKGAIDYCLKNSEWRLSLQQHKIIGVR